MSDKSGWNFPVDPLGDAEERIGELEEKLTECEIEQGGTMEIDVSGKRYDEGRPEGMSWKDWLERLSWTATYRDGSLEIVVGLDYALAAVAELEKRLREANDPTWPQLSALS